MPKRPSKKQMQDFDLRGYRGLTGRRAPGQIYEKMRESAGDSQDVEIEFERDRPWHGWT